ncbi:glycosyltransferase [Terrabacter sp. BE26]|uniref:glycosyltransferase n=1 Tax=Terrabacter sp. BE26 TaxID=2898152 RepID=UPI0035BE8E3F
MDQAALPIFDVIVVGYNSLLVDSPAVLAAQSAPLVRTIFYCDNSTDPSTCAQNKAAKGPKVTYLGLGGNLGISRAYNAALNHCQAQYVVLFDDDTAVETSFFEDAASWVREGVDGDGVFVPVVTTAGKAFSPCRHFLGTFRPIEDLSGLRLGSFSAINSGMVIARSVFSGYRYDERLFLEFVDHKFVSDVRKRGIPVTIMSNVVLNQTFSAVSDDLSAALRRHEIFRRDSAVFYSGVIGRLVRWARLGVRYVKLSRMGNRA